MSAYLLSILPKDALKKAFNSCEGGCITSLAPRIATNSLVNTLAELLRRRV